MHKAMVGALVGIIIVGAGSFYAGSVYGKGQSAPQTNRQFGAGMMGGSRMGNRAGGFQGGSVVAVGNGSVTVQLPNGSTELVLTNDKTQVFKTVAGTLADVVVGANVTIGGAANSDGSITAQSLQIRPAGFAPRSASTTQAQ